ncbi:MAG: type I DNA topoisomerase [Lentimicrobiaceae bacterium]|nr:type I DNA topoisomerase [Lentimicrobiaceae bacterium]
MIKNLVIVESPAKAKTIEGFLGKEFLVKSSYGHIRDLYKNQLSIDVENGFLPRYEIPEEKLKMVNELKKIATNSETVWLASDEDREGEAIAWHLTEALSLEKSKIKRIVFHEITKTAIANAIENPRNINYDLVNAQQARRVLDRLVGYELSPLLWKKVKPALSAGRVQSVAVRLIAEKETEIREFVSVDSYRITAIFEGVHSEKLFQLNAELNKRFLQNEEAVAFLESCKEAGFVIAEIETKPSKKSPAPPFTTSTLQQEASRKLGFSVAQTMRVAQQLYESGKITYMRTDSVHLSNLALDSAKKEIGRLFGENYVKTRQYETKSKGAQEAHEAIRPTYLEKSEIEGDLLQKRLYDLIWKRTIASQMSDAQIQKTNVTIDISTRKEKFIAKGEVILFDGFLKVYTESNDEDTAENQKNTLPPVAKGEQLTLQQMIAEQKFSQQPFRYTEASLVKKLEELGIGRPSTYAPTISTIQKREYVVKEDRVGFEREYKYIVLKNKKITSKTKSEKVGYEKTKLFPTDIGNLVNAFLLQYFENIIDYNFTANVELEFDEIASGNKNWNEMLYDFYHSFHQQVEKTLKVSEKVKGQKLLGTDAASGKNVYAKLGRYGAIIQIGETEDEEKPRFAGLKKGQSIETITLTEALDLFQFPKSIGKYEDSELLVAIGRFGPYVKHKSAFYSLKKTDDPSTITVERAIELIEEKRKADSEKIIKIFAENPDIKIQKGRWGAYISFGKNNFKIPKGTDPETLTLDDCLQITGTQQKTESKKNKKSLKPATKTKIKK